MVVLGRKTRCWVLAAAGLLVWLAGCSVMEELWPSDEDLAFSHRLHGEQGLSCEDCHDVHRVSGQDPFGNVAGFSNVQVRLRKAQFEYEVCYKCHSDSANLPLEQQNLRLLFDRKNPSYHPVEGPGRNGDVPSLVSGLSAASTIRCTDCHGNDDKGGPRGPHGSEYDAMLRFNYERSDIPESPHAFELCYRCHDRQSILGDKSFRAHSRHVLYAGASCAACHEPHGSPLNPDLIEFDLDIVQGDRLYMDASGGRPKCFLTCHGIEHNDAFFSSRGW